MKPDVADAGPEEAPTPGDAVRGRGRHRPRRPLQRPRPARAALRRARRPRSPACSWSRCSRTSASSCPTRATSPAVRAMCDAHGSLLVFDEVKTGLTAGYAGASQRLGVTPDLVVPRQEHRRRPAARGVRRARRGHGVRDRRPHAALRHLQRQPARDGRRGRHRRDRHRRGPRVPPRSSTSTRSRQMNAIIAEHDLPAHTVGFGVKGAVTWSATPVRNYRDYKRTDFGAAELSLAVGRQPRHPHPARARRAVARLARAHARRHGPARRRVPRARRGAARLTPSRALPRLLSRTTVVSACTR